MNNAVGVCSCDMPLQGNIPVEITFQAIYQRYYADYEPYDAFLFHAQEELAGIDLPGKMVLEIGCGKGAFSVYMALSGGAARVVALDEAEGYGADKGNLQQLQAIIDRHALTTLEIMKADINESELFPVECFDLIVSNFAIHHSLATNRKQATRDEVDRELQRTFMILNRYLKRGGKIILREMSGINFWRYMPYRWKMSHIDWHIHPTRRQWRRALKAAGFGEVTHSFLTPYCFSKLPPRLVRNPFANFFFSSSFYLYGTK